MESSFLCITARFIDPVPSFHGRGEGDTPEWPPSPLRLFQTLVAAAAAKWTSDKFEHHAGPALTWLERRVPVIVTPTIQAKRTKYRRYILNNQGDLMAGKWDRGNPTATMAKYHTEKDVCPTRMIDGNSVHFLFPLTDSTCPFLDVLRQMAHSIFYLGWSVDRVVATAEVLSTTTANQLAGERWYPSEAQSNCPLRTPVAGTLVALIQKHQEKLQQVQEQENKLTAPLPLTTFNRTNYRRASDPPPCPYAGFQLRTLDNEKFQAFAPITQTHIVAAMMRHVTSEAAINGGWPATDVNTFILGHGDGPNTKARNKPRFAYLPLPSIEPRSQGARIVGAIRRVLVVEVPTGSGKRRTWANQVLPGRHLTPIDSSTPPALLEPLPADDHAIQHFIKPAAEWCTVTPVLLPGVGARNDRSIERLIRTAMRHAGISHELATNAGIEWRSSGFLPGVDLASRYQRPNHLRGYYPVHLKITWRDSQGQPIPIPGPICIGAGLFYGLGLMASGV